MARAKIDIMKNQLIDAINTCEHAQTFANRQALVECVAQQLPVKVSAAWVQLKIKEWNIEPKTPKGKRGRPEGMKLTKDQQQKMREGKKKKNYDVSEMRERFPKSCSKLLDRVARGSLRATITAKCIECAGFVRKEVKECQIKSCANWHERPYK